MRAVVFSPNPLSHIGGVERFCALVSDVLRDEGWTVDVVWPDPVPHPPHRLAAMPMQARSVAHKARTVLAGARPDLLITNGFLGAAAPPAGHRIEVVHRTAPAAAMACPPDRGRRGRAGRIIGAAAIEELACRGATVVAVSDTVAAEVRRLCRSDVDAVVPHGVDTDRFRPRDRAEARLRLGLSRDGCYAFYPGRVDGRGGTDLMETGAVLAGYELLVTGSRAPVVGKALGHLDPDELALAYNAADCVLLPVRYAGCSCVVLEALASGTALLTTRVGWFQGFLRDVPDYRALVIRPDADDVAARLLGLTEMDLAPLLRQGRDHVLQHNGLARWRADWRTLIRGAVAA